MRVDDSTPITVPLRNLIAVGVGLCLFVGQFFLLEGRIATLEEHSRKHTEEIEYAKTFRFQWARGELGLVGVDIEQNIRLDHVDRQLNRIREAGQHHAQQDDEHN